MKALTLRPPWPHAVMFLGKDVDNRKTNIAGSHRGFIALHAGKTEDQHWGDWRGADRISQALRDGLPSWSLYTPKGYIVGVVELVGVHHDSGRTVHDEDHQQCSPWAQPDMWHLEFANPRPLREPIAIDGRLGLWTLPADVAQRVVAQLLVDEGVPGL